MWPANRPIMGAEMWRLSGLLTQVISNQPMSLSVLLPGDNSERLLIALSHKLLNLLQTLRGMDYLVHLVVVSAVTGLAVGGIFGVVRKATRERRFTTRQLLALTALIALWVTALVWWPH